MQCKRCGEEIPAERFRHTTVTKFCSETCNRRFFWKAWAQSEAGRESRADYNRRYRSSKQGKAMRARQNARYYQKRKLTQKRTWVPRAPVLT